MLLRYELGDYGRITSVPCACGRTSRRLVELEGKRFVNLRLPDGTTVHSATLWGVIKRVGGVRRFQIVQHAPDRFEIRLVTDDRSTYDAILPDVLSGMRALLPGCEVDASWHAELPPSRAGDSRRSSAGGRADRVLASEIARTDGGAWDSRSSERCSGAAADPFLP